MMLRRKWVKETVSEDTWRYEVLQQIPPNNREIQNATEEGWEARWTAYLNST
ncbi:hypothetical protein GJ744_004826 [Endocarpon pusillum]|uniref:Uncharacterized protein n=1 Tax=Endocarpon pusillum TaxID=364733 RepID=A0A8H7A9A7_9EURO|nr:hypothetical protein GJ744_004826 [Endocarpon pusillum]